MKKTVLLFLLAFSASAFAENQTYYCMETALLTGKLSLETTRDEHYEDKYVPVRFPAINLTEPINVVSRKNNEGGECDDKYENVKLLQLGLQEKDYALFKKNIGKTARIKCELNPSMTAHHYTNPWCFVQEDNSVEVLDSK